jgi:radical SAM-linked protein
VKWNDPPHSVLEAVFARGDRRLGRTIRRAWELGARFDGWSEIFREDLWRRAFEETSIDPIFLAQRERSEDEILPWSHLSAGVETSHLRQEYHRAIMEEYTPDCRWDQCSLCGVCDHKAIRPRLHAEADEQPRVSQPSRAPVEGRDLFLYRLRYSKMGKIRFFGQLETVQSFSRAIRRSGLPAAYSKGFHPHVKLSFTEALPLGLESLVEEAYLSLTERRDPETVQSLLNDHLPPGLRIEHAAAVIRREPPPPGMRVTYAVLDLIPWMAHKVIQEWSGRLQEELTKKTKKGEIRARLGEVLLDVRRLGETSLEMDLFERPQVCFRPTVVLHHLLGEPLERFSGCRIRKVGVCCLAKWGEKENVGRAHHQQ